MFEAITIRPNSYRNHALDYGQLIENLFFYKKTIAHIGRHEIKSLFDLADVDVLVELLKYPGFSIYYNNSHVGIANQNDERYVDSFGLANLDLEKELYQESFNYKKDEGRSKKFSKKIARLLNVYQLPVHFSSTLNEQIKNEDFRQTVLLESLKYHYSDFKFDPRDLRYELEFSNDKTFKLHNNFADLGIDTQVYSADTAILAILNACAELQIMLENQSEISLSDFDSKILRAKITSVIDQNTKSKKEIEVFSHYVFDDSWSLKEAINSKRIHIKAALQILRKADKYKDWLHDLPNNANLIREYVAKVSEKTVFETFPAKAARFYLFNGLTEILGQINPGVAVPVAIAINAFDSFIVENLSKKWKPNQFIENELRPLVKNNY